MEKAEILERAKKYIAEEKDERFRKEAEDLVAKADDKDALAELEDRFYQTLEFGTGGLRGVMGGGTNRMNTLEINLATQGLANYVLKAFPEKAKDGTLSAVVAYDSRKNSDVFAEATALILAANGIKAYLFTGLRPTPELSFAIRTLKAQTGVVVTASHNPPQSGITARRSLSRTMSASSKKSMLSRKSRRFLRKRQSRAENSF